MNKEQFEQDTGKISPEFVPLPISDYIKKNFRGVAMPEVHLLHDKCGKTFYRLDIRINDGLRHLKFDSTGSLVLDEDEPFMDLFEAEDG